MCDIISMKQTGKNIVKKVASESDYIEIGITRYAANLTKNAELITDELKIRSYLEHYNVHVDALSNTHIGSLLVITKDGIPSEIWASDVDFPSWNSIFTMIYKKTSHFN